ncbi:hypothetical protein FH972_005381 [Carpinus fangiana]|uniref:Uncharacterized protein n=1 Tax=Carpinus fangiana TaxID=176857 RepID=A0A5N6QP35_9ROSI|nr:hypothetical protein FH972_005381 [Carpinus fangiana]
MGIRESVKGKSFRRNTDSEHFSSQQFENSPAAVTPTKEEPIVSPSEKTTSLLMRLLRRKWQTTKGWLIGNHEDPSLDVQIVMETCLTTSITERKVVEALPLARDYAKLKPEN